MTNFINPSNQFAMVILDKALTTRRPHGNQSTVRFCEWLVKQLPAKPFIDKVGNIHVDLREKGSETLFVAHVDTVHRSGGKNRVIKTNRRWSANGAPLGADDGAGVAVLMHMIRAKVPGYYIFTQGEECGGIGSGWLADHNISLLKQFKRAVAFDRRATYSIITHQGYGRCCSDAFGDALATQFNELGMLYMTDDTGVYTDTEEFAHIIPECTNISVGYDMEHSDRETLDIKHFTELLEAVLRVRWDDLPVKRDPNDRVLALKSYYGKVDLPLFDKSVASKKGNTSLVDEIDTSFKYDLAGLGLACDDHEFKQAMREADRGRTSALVEMIAATISPGDFKTAMNMIDRRKITKQFLKNLREDSKVVDVDVLLTCAFDEIGTIWVQ